MSNKRDESIGQLNEEIRRYALHTLVEGVESGAISFESAGIIYEKICNGLEEGEKQCQNCRR